MEKLILRHIQGWKVLLFFLLSTGIYLTMLFVTIPRLTEMAGGMNILDMLPTGYDANYVQKLFNSLGEQGRHFYLARQIPLDLIYPALFGISNCLILGYLLSKLGRLTNPWVYLCLIPLIAGIFDYAENVGVILLLRAYPDLSESLVSLNSVFTVLKSGFTTLFFVILIGLLGWLLLRVLKKV